MTEAASDFGVQASFSLPSMTSSALGDVLTATATSLTRTQTEMTDLGTKKQRNIRDVVRESRRRASEEQVQSVTEEAYEIYPLSGVERFVYKEWWEGKGYKCRRQSSYEEAPMLHQKTRFVAMNRASFGEGSERFAFRFFELGSDGSTVLGKPLVAKESRLDIDGRENSQQEFVRSFCRTQQLARRIAVEFNEKLDSLYKVSKETPRVSFLDCSVYVLSNENGKQHVLVEEKLDSLAWHKWNANNGFVEGMKSAPVFTHDMMKKAVDHLTNIQLTDIQLDAIVEEEEDMEEDVDGADNEEGVLKSDKDHNHSTAKHFSASEVAQAFSHFSYLATGKKRLICDLQGVFDTTENILKFSDPVIHYHNPNKEERRSVHGRTDLGRRGMAMFFDTHKCNCGHLCRLVTLGFRHFKQRKHHT